MRAPMDAPGSDEEWRDQAVGLAMDRVGEALLFHTEAELDAARAGYVLAMSDATYALATAGER